MAQENNNGYFWSMPLANVFANLSDEAHEISGMDPKKADIFVIADKVLDELRSGE